MKSRGMLLSLNYIILIILGLVVLVAAALIIMRADTLADIIPGFERNEQLDIEGVRIVGFNLEDGEVYAYDGRDWILREETFELLGSTVPMPATKEAFHAFWTGERNGSNLFYTDGLKGAEVSFIDNSVGTSYLSHLRIVYSVKPPYVWEPFTPLNLWLRVTDNRFDDSASARSAGSEDQINAALTDLASIKDELIAWRDQILKGHPCEKYIRLLNPAQPFSVEKQGKFLFVDLDKLATNPEPYQNCAPEIRDRSNWVNDAMIRLRYFDSDGVLTGIRWTIVDGEQGWYYSGPASNNENVPVSQVLKRPLLTNEALEAEVASSWRNMYAGLTSILKAFNGMMTKGYTGLSATIIIHPNTVDSVSNEVSLPVNSIGKITGFEGYIPVREAILLEYNKAFSPPNPLEGYTYLNLGSEYSSESVTASRLAYQGEYLPIQIVGAPVAGVSFLQWGTFEGTVGGYNYLEVRGVAGALANGVIQFNPESDVPVEYQAHFESLISHFETLNGHLLSDMSEVLP